MWREGGTTIATVATPTVTLSMGVHTLTLEVTDDDGASTTDNVVITVNPSNQVTVTVSTAQANEAGPTNGIFTVTRTGSTSVPLTVNYTITGTAAAGTDYTALPGVVTMDAGSATATLIVTPIDDASYESNETVILTLSPNAAYSLGAPSAGTVTIVSNDLPPDLYVSAMTVPATTGADVDIVVTDTTKNQGTGSSPASTTGFYLSINGTLDAGDVWLGSRPVPALAPGATNSASTTLHIPASVATGSYRVLAKADWESAVNEGVETNNVSWSSIINLGPDLIVSAAHCSRGCGGGSVNQRVRHHQESRRRFGGRDVDAVLLVDKHESLTRLTRCWGAARCRSSRGRCVKHRHHHTDGAGECGHGDLLHHRASGWRSRVDRSGRDQ